MSDNDPKNKQKEESLQSKIDDFNLFLEELESEWVEEDVEVKPVIEPVKVEKIETQPKSKVVKEKKAIPKPRPVDPSTQEIHVDLETGEVTFDDLEDFEDQEVGQEALDELLDADISETIEIEDVKREVAAIKESTEPIEIYDEETEHEKQEEEDQIIFGRVERSQHPEQFAHNYLFARLPITVMLILIPQTIGLLVGVFVNTSFIYEPTSTVGGEKKLITSTQEDLIDNYLLAAKISLVILLAFFLCYRWSTMQNDGSYGYWLTQGVNRRKFFIETIYKFLFVIYFGILLGLLSTIYLNGVYFDFQSFIMLNLLILSHILLMITVGVTVGVLLKNPESASLLFIISFGINYAFNTSTATIWNKILQSDVQYNENIGDIWLSLIGSTGLGLILAAVSLRIHINMDMEL